MTTQCTEFDEFVRMLAQMNELQRRVAHGSLELRTVRRGLQSLIEGDPATSCRIPSHFVSLAHQIENVERWNAEFGWNIPDALIARRCLEARTFDWPGDPLQAIVLVPSLDSPTTTLTALAKAASRLRVWPYNTQKAIHDNQAEVWLMDGIDFTPNTLEWRLVDLGSHLYGRGSRRLSEPLPKASELVTTQTAAHAEVLAAAAHFPRWLQAIKEGQAPAVAIPGYQMNDPDVRTGEGPRTAYLSISFGSGDISTTLHSYSFETLWEGRAVATARPMTLGR